MIKKTKRKKMTTTIEGMKGHNKSLEKKHGQSYGPQLFMGQKINF